MDAVVASFPVRGEDRQGLRERGLVTEDLLDERQAVGEVPAEDGAGHGEDEGAAAFVGDLARQGVQDRSRVEVGLPGDRVRQQAGGALLAEEVLEAADRGRYDGGRGPPVGGRQVPGADFRRGGRFLRVSTHGPEP